MASFHQKFALALVLLIAAQVCSATHEDYETLVGYSLVSDPKVARVVIVAGTGSGTNNLSLADFGSVVVYDAVVTQSPDPKSKTLGYLGGPGTYIGKTDLQALIINSFHFSDKSGTLIFAGSIDPTPRGVSQILGGDGDYLFAKGLVELYRTDNILKVTIKYKKVSKNELKHWY